MNVHIANYSEQQVGGGWSYIANLMNGCQQLGGVSFVDYEKAEIYLIPSASMVQREQVKMAKADGKKIILRVDNALRHSRNRSTGMSRLWDFAEMADEIVFQSEWAKQVIGKEYLQTDRGSIIVNGVNQEIFNMNQRTEDLTARFTYSRYNRDETKNWEMARYIYQQAVYTADVPCQLNILGRFSDDLRSNNFDFYQDEAYRFWGVQPAPMVSQILQNTDYFIYTYFNDACSNSLIEALCCGCEIVDTYNMLDTGGSAQIMDIFNDVGVKYFNHLRMAREYIEVFNG